MRNSVAKKIRKNVHKEFKTYLKEVSMLSFRTRLKIAWRILWAR